MRIHTLEIRDFRSHANTQIELHPRLNIFLGPNGSGKSSIRDAIAVLLCGRTPDLAFEGKDGKRNMERITREGANLFDLVMTSDQGIHRARCADGRLSLENQPEIVRDRALWALAPGMFFDAGQARRDQIIAETVGINFRDASGKLEARAKKLKLDKNYNDWYIMDLTDLQRKIKRFEEDRRKAKKELDGLAQFRDMALPEGISQEHLMEYNQLHREIGTHRESMKRLEELVPELEKNLKTVAGAKEDPAKLAEELEKERTHLANLKMQYNYANAGQCPLGLECSTVKDKAAMAEHVARIKTLGTEQKAKVADLDKRWQEANSRNSLSKKLSEAKDELALLQAAEPEIQRKEKRYLELVELDAFAKLDVAKRKAELEQAEAQHEALDDLLTYIHKELLPVTMGADAKFSELIAGLSPFPVSYESGEFRLNGRNYELLSSSQKYRCQIAVAKALSGGLGIVVLDGFELLDYSGQMMGIGQALKDEDHQTLALIGYTKKTQPGTDPPVPVEALKAPKPEAGRMFWCYLEQGITRIQVIQ